MSRNARMGVVLGFLVLGALIAWVRRPVEGTVELLSPETAAQDAGVDRATEQRVTALRTAAAGTDGGVPEARTTGGAVVASFGWGSGEGQLGRSRPDEANPEAPMSLTVDALGQIWVLDQVNGRLVKMDRDGKSAGSVPVPLQAAQDVVVTADGTALVMDRLVDKAVAVIGPDGKPRGELPILGKGLEEGGASTGLFTDGEDVYVEREHGDAVKIGNVKGEANRERPEVPGRPAQDGRTLLTAGIVDASTGAVTVTAIERATQQHRFTRQLVLGNPVAGLNALDADRSGIIYLGTVLELPESTPEAPKFGITLLCLDPLDGRPLAATRIPANASPEETFRELQVLPEGGVLFLQRTEQGAQVVRYQCGQ